MPVRGRNVRSGQKSRSESEDLTASVFLTERLASDRFVPHRRSSLVKPVGRGLGYWPRLWSASSEQADTITPTGPTSNHTLGSGVTVGGCPKGAGLRARAFHPLHSGGGLRRGIETASAVRFRGGLG